MDRECRIATPSAGGACAFACERSGGGDGGLPERANERERERESEEEREKGGGDVRGRKSESERGRAVTAATTAAATNLGPAADNHYGKDRRRRQY